MDFKGVRLIVLDGEEYLPETLFASPDEIVLPEAAVRVAKMLNNFPLFILTTYGATLRVKVERFPYPGEDGSEFVAFGVQISPIQGEILSVLQLGDSEEHGTISDLACTPQGVEMTQGWPYHIAIYFTQLVQDEPLKPPSWVEKRTHVM